jgi:lysylphosphatidylglycerol synthetase-like protein (DUF2156 family)
MMPTADAAASATAAGSPGQRIVLRADTAARRIVAVGVLCVVGWLIVLASLQHHLAASRALGGMALPVAVLAAIVLIARGIVLGRPVTAAHAVAATITLNVGMAAHVLSLHLVGNVLIAAAGWLLMWPTTTQAQPGALPWVWALVDATYRDPLAPFAMQSHKSYHFNADNTAALAYRARLGFAVVSGDPIGDETRFPDLVADFARMCRARGWRVIVLGCSEARLALWRNGAIRQATVAVPIGRDVVIDVQRFTMAGRRFRNLRQAVQRTHNRGVTTEVVAERNLDAALTAELAAVLLSAHGGSGTERGFSMNLDSALERRYPGIMLILARDRRGRIQGFHRYATAGHGSEVTLEAPFRRPGAPNGIDERLSVDMIAHAKAHGGQRVSFAFAAFPEIFANPNRGPLHRLFFRLIHLLDPLIRLESLYRYLRKFHAVGQQRYAVLCAHHIPVALAVLLSLEFIPRRRHLRQTRAAHVEFEPAAPKRSTITPDAGAYSGTHAARCDPTSMPS